MKSIAQIISWFALAGTIVPPLLFMADKLPLPQVKAWMLVATILWFVATPIWMERKKA
jgi:uncharacterized membrane protein YfcA